VKFLQSFGAESLEHRVCEFGCLVGYFIRSDGRCFCEGLQNLGAGSVRRVYEL